VFIKKFLYKFQSTFTESIRPVLEETNRQSTSPTFSERNDYTNYDELRPRRFSSQDLKRIDKLYQIAVTRYYYQGGVRTNAISAENL